MVRIHEGSPLYIMFGRLAQLVERYPYKVDVTSSSLVATTINHMLRADYDPFI